MSYITQRLSERSTRLGLVTILGSALALFFPQYSTIINAATGAIGAAYAATQG